MIDYTKDDYIVRASAKSGLIRGFAMRSTALVEEARRIHQLCPTSTLALGQLLTATTLLAQDLKTDGASITLSVRGDGLLSTLLTVGNDRGEVRGFSEPAAVETRYTADGRIDVARAIGEGSLTLSRDDGIEREAYASTVKLTGLGLSNDIASYLLHSAQIPSVVALGVKLDHEGVQHAGGLIVQLMPGWDEHLADWLEARASGFPEITYWFEEGMNPHQLLDLLLGDPDIVYADPTRATYRCNCSAERMLDNLFTLPANDINELIDDPNGVSIDCHFCDRKYHFGQSVLSTVRDLRLHQGDG